MCNIETYCMINYCIYYRSISLSLFQTGPSYGRKMMTGYLSARGISVAEARVGRVLRETHRPYHEARQRVRKSCYREIHRQLNINIFIHFTNAAAEFYYYELYSLSQFPLIACAMAALEFTMKNKILFNSYPSYMSIVGVGIKTACCPLSMDDSLKAFVTSWDMMIGNFK